MHAGSTGVSLAMVAAAAGCRCAIALPDDAAAEKAQLLACLGAHVRAVRPVSITHPGHFVNVARRVRDIGRTHHCCAPAKAASVCVR